MTSACCTRFATRNNIYDPVGLRPIWPSESTCYWKSIIAIFEKWLPKIKTAIKRYWLKIRYFLLNMSGIKLHSTSFLFHAIFYKINRLWDNEVFWVFQLLLKIWNSTFLVEDRLNLIHTTSRKLHSASFLFVTLFWSDWPSTRYWEFFGNGFQKICKTPYYRFHGKFDIKLYVLGVKESI